MSMDVMTFEQAYSLLASTEGVSDGEAICAAITRLGKPYDEQLALLAAPLVLKYLHYGNPVVRYQAIWFLGCWGKLYEYLASVVQAAQSDPNVDNRAYAARCVGQVLKSHHDANATLELLTMATSEGEEPEVRQSAYSALLYAFYGEAARNQARDFEPIGSKAVKDFNLTWLASLPQWIEGLSEKSS
jgi:vesicle coat complex subunit